MIFIDTGAFFARYVKRDQHHETANAFWISLAIDKRRCFTSNFVLDELATLLARKTTYDFAAQRMQTLFESEWLSILRPEANDESEALQWFAKYADQSVSFTDCTSFVLIRKFGIKSIFTFDRHFELAGFAVEP